MYVSAAIAGAIVRGANAGADRPHSDATADATASDAALSDPHIDAVGVKGHRGVQFPREPD